MEYPFDINCLSQNSFTYTHFFKIKIKSHLVDDFALTAPCVSKGDKINAALHTRK